MRSSDRALAWSLGLLIAGCAGPDGAVGVGGGDSPAGGQEVAGGAGAPESGRENAVQSDPGGTLEGEYVNTEFGWRIDLPEGWHAQDDNPGYVILTSYDMSTAEGRGGVPDDKTKIDIIANPAAGDDIEGAADALVSGAVEVTRREEWTLDTGEPAVRVDFASQNAGQVSALVTGIGGRVLLFMAYGGAENVDGMYRSVRSAGP